MVKPKLSRAVIGARLLHRVDDFLRRNQRGRGDMSKLIQEAVEAVDLSSVELIRIHGKRETPTARATQVVIPVEMRRDLERWSEKRECTMNELLNSALVAALLRGRSDRNGTSTEARGKMTASDLKATIEVTKQGRRFLVKAITGGELVRVREIGEAPYLEKRNPGGGTESRSR